MWQDFNLDEFECKCGCGLNNTQHYFIDKLQDARDRAKIPFFINSGCRCPKHNAKVGGRKNSDHLTGEGADIFCDDSYSRFKITTALIAAGIERIGISGKFIHAGSCIDNPQQVVWLY